MKTAGELLKQARKKKRTSLRQAAKATKIKLEYLQALEEDAFQNLPSLTSAKGFLKNYAEFLGLSSERILAIFRRDLSKEKTEKFLSPETARPLSGPRLNWSSNLGMIIAIAILVLGFLIYLIWQYFSLTSAPYY